MTAAAGWVQDKRPTASTTANRAPGALMTRSVQAIIEIVSMCVCKRAGRGHRLLHRTNAEMVVRLLGKTASSTHGRADRRRFWELQIGRWQLLGRAVLGFELFQALNPSGTVLPAGCKSQGDDEEWLLHDAHEHSTSLYVSRPLSVSRTLCVSPQQQLQRSWCHAITTPRCSPVYTHKRTHKHAQHHNCPCLPAWHLPSAALRVPTQSGLAPSPHKQPAPADLHKCPKTSKDSAGSAA